MKGQRKGVVMEGMLVCSFLAMRERKRVSHNQVTLCSIPLGLKLSWSN